MKGTPTCPRCSEAAHPPGLWSSAWTCPVHGEVAPLQPLVQPSPDVLALVAKEARVPAWLPWPLPRGWLVTGVAHAGDDRTGPRAVALACSGPAPLGGMGELVLVAEEPGVGLGARYAGLPGPDPGEAPSAPPAARLQAAGHETALWCLPAPADRAAFVGEARGCWLWLVLWPEPCGAMLLEDLELADARDVVPELALVPVGALTPRLQPE
ncbi:DUF6758 family protein [Vallicoccus soli]|uniref:Phosphotransacetylase n=1 Tax=Vallicoccus soli TaxID=2339232 RepID=A0A3A3ZMU1_9ACTN|nr:DUF6758 family protein [Vallicoccus soli]RJK98055.1 hypothetical protein D5H78_03715 [Vallicoccus soli]